MRKKTQKRGVTRGCIGPRHLSILFFVARVLGDKAQVETECLALASPLSVAAPRFLFRIMKVPGLDQRPWLHAFDSKNEKAERRRVTSFYKKRIELVQNSS